MSEKPGAVQADLAAVEILRDRERGVPRYCEFRRLLDMKVPESFLELTGGRQDLAREIEAVYGTSSLTVTSLSGCVRGPADLVHVNVGAIQDSQPQTLLQTKFGVKAAYYPGFRQGLEALEKGDISAFVVAEPVLRYEIANNFPGRLAVVGAPFLRADFVFAFPLGSVVRKQANRSILSYVETTTSKTAAYG